jgi:hypothetical protein
MLLPRNDREVQDAIGLRYRMMQVTERRERRVNGADRLRNEPRPKLFLVKPGMDFVLRTAEKNRRVLRPASIAKQPKISNVIQMPSRNPVRRTDPPFGGAAGMSSLAWLGHALLSLVRFR